MVELETPQEGLDRQDELYGLAGIFNRCMELTVEFKYEQGKRDAYLMLPVEYLVGCTAALAGGMRSFGRQSRL